MIPRDIIDEAEGISRKGSLFPQILTMSLEALSGRALVWVTALGSGALWTVAMLDPSWLRIAVATGFCVTVLFPILHRDARG